MTEIVAEQTIWFPGLDYVGREDDYAKRASEVIGEGGREKLIELVEQRAREDGEWAIENSRVGGRPEFMRKMMAWVSDPKNIIQCYESRLEYDSTVDWICRELANVTKGIAGGLARD